MTALLDSPACSVLITYADGETYLYGLGWLTWAELSHELDWLRDTNGAECVLNARLGWQL